MERDEESAARPQSGHSRMWQRYAAADFCGRMAGSGEALAMSVSGEDSCM